MYVPGPLDRARHVEPPVVEIDLGIVDEIGVERKAIERRDVAIGERRRESAERNVGERERASLIARPLRSAHDVPVR